MNENNSIILDLIKNYFGYTDESFSYLKEQLENHTSDEYIEKIFSNSKDERIYFPIPLNCKEKIDEGWALFKKLFLDFASAYEIKYTDFVENKIMVNKNLLKLKKALLSFYIKKRSEILIQGFASLGAGPQSVILGHANNEKNILVTRAGGDLGILSFEENEKSINFTTLSEVIIYNGRSICKTPTYIKSALKLNANITAKTSLLNTIAFLKNSEENFVSFYVNKISEGGTNFFRRQKLSTEITERYFSKKVFLSNTNDDRIIKMWYINSNDFISSVLFRIEVETGEVVFYNEVSSDIDVFNVLNFTVLDKEKHSELYLTIKENDKTLLKKYVTENGINFALTSQDFSSIVNPNTSSVHYYNNYVYYTKSSGITILSNIINNSSLSEEIKTAIEKDINKKLECVGVKSLPKNKEINVVISKNFADWFLCSSAETWSSCLNLESKHSSSHWQGLPALLGDKDRVMFYITDGTKKTYKGITVDKILARTWGILDNKNVFNTIKFYPFEILSIEELNKTTNIPISIIKSNFVSKNSIIPIFYKYSDPKFLVSSFIFQDKTSFVKMNDGYHLHFCSGNGYYTIVKNLSKNTEDIQQISVFDFTEGLSSLKDNNAKITSFFKRISLSEERCTCCGNIIREGYDFHTIEERIICDRCFNRYYYHCNMCNNTYSKEDVPFETVIDEEGGTVHVCSECCTKHIIECEICGKKILKVLSNIYFNIESKKIAICNDCLDKEDEPRGCCNCGSFFHKEIVNKHLFYDYRNNCYCNKCLFEMSDKKQMKFGFFVE